MIQLALGDDQSMRYLQARGVIPSDPAALPIILKKDPILRDHWGTKFAYLSVLAIVDDWNMIPMTLAQHVLIERNASKYVIIAGTADHWRSQILSECRSSNQNRTRLQVFNQCYDLLSKTGLKSMFEDLHRIQHGEVFYLQ